MKSTALEGKGSAKGGRGVGGFQERRGRQQQMELRDGDIMKGRKYVELEFHPMEAGRTKGRGKQLKNQ